MRLGAKIAGDLNAARCHHDGRNSSLYRRRRGVDDRLLGGDHRVQLFRSHLLNGLGGQRFLFLAHALGLRFGLQPLTLALRVDRSMPGAVGVIPLLPCPCQQDLIQRRSCSPQFVGDLAAEDVIDNAPGIDDAALDVGANAHLRRLINDVSLSQHLPENVGCLAGLLIGRHAVGVIGDPVVDHIDQPIPRVEQVLPLEAQPIRQHVGVDQRERRRRIVVAHARTGIVAHDSMPASASFCATMSRMMSSSVGAGGGGSLAGWRRTRRVTPKSPRH